MSDPKKLLGRRLTLPATLVLAMPGSENRFVCGVDGRHTYLVMCYLPICTDWVGAYEVVLCTM